MQADRMQDRLGVLLIVVSLVALLLLLRLSTGTDTLAERRWLGEPTPAVSR